MTKKRMDAKASARVGKPVGTGPPTMLLKCHVSHAPPSGSRRASVSEVKKAPASPGIKGAATASAHPKGSDGEGSSEAKGTGGTEGNSESRGTGSTEGNSEAKGTGVTEGNSEAKGTSIT